MIEERAEPLSFLENRLYANSMTPIHPHDYIQSYEAGVEALKTQPLDRKLQHGVVLALARAGALDFAMSEYDRFGMAAVRDNEDIMALSGRLSKDLYLRASGKTALKHAQDAACKYEAAFQNTLGYYSGINSATMALMADMPAERVSARIEAIEALLPISRDVTSTDHYFVEATRAECSLLRGERAKAVTAFHAAIDFDPLNYAAHATTLKQFIMISAKRGEGLDWLSDFKPPRPLHYAGHIRLQKTVAEQLALKISISDALQQEDVGFGFGALAAGGDILFAESLLEQGAELHVILPCDKEVFLRESVLPFGEDWGPRFEDCLAHASSLRILTEHTNWPDKYLNRLGGLSAMGHAILQGRSLIAAPLQMLILNDTLTPSYTTTHAEDWAGSGHAQFRIADGSHHVLKTSPLADYRNVPCAIKQSGDKKAELYQDITLALTRAFERQVEQNGVQIALHVQIESENTDAILDQILEGGAPQCLLASETFASVLAVKGSDKYKMTYAGRVAIDTTNPIRCYTLQEGQ